MFKNYDNSLSHAEHMMQLTDGIEHRTEIQVDELNSKNTRRLIKNDNDNNNDNIYSTSHRTKKLIIMTLIAIYHTKNLCLFVRVFTTNQQRIRQSGH